MYHLLGVFPLSLSGCFRLPLVGLLAFRVNQERFIVHTYVYEPRNAVQLPNQVGMTQREIGVANRRGSEAIFAANSRQEAVSGVAAERTDHVQNIWSGDLSGVIPVTARDAVNERCCRLEHIADQLILGLLERDAETVCEFIENRILVL